MMWMWSDSLNIGSTSVAQKSFTVPPPFKSEEKFVVCKNVTIHSIFYLRPKTHLNKILVEFCIFLQLFRHQKPAEKQCSNKWENAQQICPN